MGIEKYEEEHNRIIEQINALNLEIPSEAAKGQYLYTQARVYAYKIAGHYKAQYKHYEAQAEIQQGLGYKAIRKGESEQYKDLKTAQDAQYLSRITKGRMLDEAAQYEGEYTTWRGIADTYESACNALKDLLKTMYSEGA
jgi:hypothetical protein